MTSRKVNIILITLLLVFTSFFQVPEATAEEQSVYVKIGLAYGSSAVQTCTLKSQQGFLLGTVSDAGFSEGMALPAYTTIIAVVENGFVVLKDENGVLLSADLGSTGCIMPYNYLDNGLLSYHEKNYRGGIMLLANSKGTMTVINFLSLEHYIYGVLNAELNYTNPPEALKAQAVAARTYAVLNKGKHSTDGFDLCSGTHCQVYQGYSGEYPATNQAVDDTRGEMICCNGKPVSIFYFKNSGGYTQNAEDVWSFSQPHLKAVKDEYSPEYPWNATLSFEEILQKLNAAGYHPGEIRTVSVKGRNTNGSVSELSIEGSSQTVNLTKEKIRTVFGSTVIKSQMFSLTETGSNGKTKSVKLTNGSTQTDFGSEVYLISGSGAVSKVSVKSVYGTNGTSTVTINGKAAVEEVTGGTVTFTGYGYGHGVGMPQDSAVVMAKQGFTYQQILEYYYTGVEIR